MTNRIDRWVSTLLAATLVLTIATTPNGYAQSQPDSRTFPETGKTVSGKFLQYWDTHGGLAQQGYPISDQLTEVSDIDGKPYTMQYFERAVFELHPENASPNDVLLSLLGSLLYKQKYPSRAPSQSTNASPDTVMFKETGHSVGGKFLAYWQAHGGLAQQGYPISDEFTEVSDLDGKPYLVQYFERAVFELHSEFAGTPNEVLLSQLGTFRYRDKYLRPKPSPSPTAVSVLPTSTPTSGTGLPNSDCSGIPESVHMTVTPNCSARGWGHTFEGVGFRTDEPVHVWLTDPVQRVFELSMSEHANDAGKVYWRLSTNMIWLPGIWVVSMRGQWSGVQGFGYLKLIVEGIGMDCSGVPPSVSMTVVPDCGPAGVYIEFNGSGFRPGEEVGRYYTSPTGEVLTGSGHSIADDRGAVNGITLRTTISETIGIWSATYEGTDSLHKAIGYFKLTPPGPPRP